MKSYQTICDRCNLCQTAHTVGMNGHGNLEQGGVIIFVDNPNLEEDRKHRFGEYQAHKLLLWLLARMTISLEHIRIEYTIKCHADDKQIKTKAKFEPIIEACSTHRIAILQKLKPKSIVAMGRLSCYAFLDGAAHGKKEGASWRAKEKEVREICEKIWIAYSPAYALQSPTETPRLYRVLFEAAKEAGLKPRFNPTLKLFNYDI